MHTRRLGRAAKNPFSPTKIAIFRRSPAGDRGPPGIPPRVRRARASPPVPWPRACRMLSHRPRFRNSPWPSGRWRPIRIPASDPPERPLGILASDRAERPLARPRPTHFAAQAPYGAAGAERLACGSITRSASRPCNAVSRGDSIIGGPSPAEHRQRFRLRCRIQVHFIGGRRPAGGARCKRRATTLFADRGPDAQTDRAPRQSGPQTAGTLNLTSSGDAGGAVGDEFNFN